MNKTIYKIYRFRLLKIVVARLPIENTSDCNYKLQGFVNGKCIITHYFIQHYNEIVNTSIQDLKLYVDNKISESDTKPLIIRCGERFYVDAKLQIAPGRSLVEFEKILQKRNIKLIIDKNSFKGGEPHPNNGLTNEYLAVIDTNVKFRIDEKTV